MHLAGAGGVGKGCRCAAATPATAVHVDPEFLGHLLDYRQHALIARAQVVFAETWSFVTLLPVHPADGLDVLHPAAHHIEIILLTGGEQEDHRSPLGLVLLRQEVGQLANDLVRLRAVERPGVAVAAQHRNLHGDIAEVPDLQNHLAVGGFRPGDEVAEDDAGVNLLEGGAVDAFDNLAFLQFASSCGGGPLLDIVDLHRHARAHQVDADPHRPEIAHQPWPVAAATDVVGIRVEEPHADIIRVIGLVALVLRHCAGSESQCDHDHAESGNWREEWLIGAHRVQVKNGSS